MTENHELVLEVPSGLPVVWADVTRVGQVLGNLVSNGVKYAPAGTTVRVSAREANGMVQVDVSDQGPGIPPEARDMVFEAFKQLDMGGQQVKGAGLGLAIAKGIVEAHGGRIWVGEGDGLGTTMSFTLPLAE